VLHELSQVDLPVARLAVELRMGIRAPLRLQYGVGIVHGWIWVATPNVKPRQGR
jgi:hypothetical protein